MRKSRLSLSAACAIGCLAATFAQTSSAAGAWNDAALAAIWNSDPQGFCAHIKDMYIRPQAIGLPTSGAVVTATTFVLATPGSANNLGDYCQVEGDIRPVNPTAPNIKFRVNLPSNWNGKAVQFGGGGYNGNIPNTTRWTTLGLPTPDRTGTPTVPAPLALGYITFAGDSGHQGVPNGNSDDASFGMNDEALLNFGYMHIKKTLDVAVEIAKARYGKKPKRVYFSGGSTGGREGLTAALRFPKDYDGILTNYPVANYMGLRLWGAGLARAVYDNDSEGWIPPALVTQIATLANQRCDALDGVVDGLVSNMADCRALSTQLLADLSCKNGETGNITTGYPNCLTQKQIERTLAIYHEGYTLPYSFAYGVNNYPGYNSLEGIVMQIGSQPQPLDPLTSGPNAHHGDRADQFVRYFVARDSTYSVLNLDIFNPGSYFQDRIIQLSWDLGALNPDYTTFMKKGGKILWLQGNDDPSVSPYSNAEVYERIVAHMGQKNVDSFIRFYLVPGLAHGGGRFSPVWDNLTTLDNWVENGVAPPNAPVVYDGTSGSTRGRSRPLCPYPTWPKYNGAGNPNVSTSFTCVLE